MQPIFFFFFYALSECSSDITVMLQSVKHQVTYSLQMVLLIIAIIIIVIIIISCLELC